MKIAVLSEFRRTVDASLEYSYARAFESAGHTVARISLADLWPSRRWLRRFDSYVSPLRGQAALRARVISLAPDRVLIVKSVGILGDTVKHWRRQGIQVVNVFPDNPFDAMGANALGSTLLGQFRALNTLFVHDRFAVGQLKQLGVRAHFLAFARDPAVQAPETWKRADPDSTPIVFVGNPDAERIRYLRAIADLGLGLWGNWHWARLSANDPLRACVRGPEINGVRMVQCLHHAAISINVLRASQKTAHNMRTFESPASAACTVSEASPGVEELMKEGVEVVTFDTPEALRAQVKNLLADRSRRKALAEAGWQRVRDDTYERRAKEILSI
jgi:hypothetical protein